MDLFVPSALRWWSGVDNNQLIAYCIFGSGESYKHETGITKESIGVLYQNVTCVY